MTFLKGKWCWLARETSKGWRLTLCVNNQNFPVRGLLTKSANDIAKITNGNGSCVFVHMKKSKSLQKAA